MSAHAITSRRELDAALAALPACPPGRVRVYRGQTTAYPRIIPSGLRKELARGAIWQEYSRRVLAQIAQQPQQSELTDDEFRNYMLWLHAVAQHYGAGSDYLDLTHDIEVALWFALHQATLERRRSILGPPGAGDAGDFPAEVEWLVYSRFAGPGVLYAFDAAPWDERAVRPEVGQLVDLANAPEPFRSARIRAQAACLMRADRGVEDGDLAPLRVAGTPLLVSWPFVDAPGLQRSVEDVFPSPEADGWFDRFLSVPMLFEPDENGVAVLRRPIPVMSFQGDDAAYQNAVEATETYFRPALLHTELPGEFAGSTPILVDAPLLAAYPPAGDGAWNHELLLGDIADAVPVLPEGTVPLQDVLVQFSTLESARWGGADALDDDAIVQRGVHIVRSAAGVSATLLMQREDTPELGAAGPVEIRLDPAQRRLVMRAGGSSRPWTPLSEQVILAKPIMIALHLMRTISPVLKAEACSSLVVDDRCHVVVGTAGAVLRRMRDPRAIADWYSVQAPDGEPYTVTTTGLGLEAFDSPSYADVPADVVRARVAERYLQPR